MNSINPFVDFSKANPIYPFVHLLCSFKLVLIKYFLCLLLEYILKQFAFFFPYCIIELKNYTSGANGVDHSAYSFMAETKRWIKGMSALMDSTDFNPWWQMYLKCYSNAFARIAPRAFALKTTEGNAHAQTRACTTRTDWLASSVNKLRINRIWIREH